MTTPKISLLIVSSFFLFLSCAKEQIPGPKSLIDLQETPPNSNCLNGGILIKSGIDKNNNNILDSSEIENKKYICNGNNAASDKQTVLSAFTYGHTSTTSGEAILYAFPDFDKNAYKDVDSIIFLANAYSYGGKAQVELYNITNKSVIDNSLIEATESFANSVIKRTENLSDKIPSGKINLGIRVRNQGGSAAAVSMVYLIIYKR